MLIDSDEAIKRMQDVIEQYKKYGKGSVIQMAEDRIEVTHLMGKKLDKPIILKWKLETKKNKMAEVARLFGKTLGEEFDVRFNGKLKCLKFDEQGLLYFDGDEWRKNYAYLDWLVRGKAVIDDD